MRIDPDWIDQFENHSKALGALEVRFEKLARYVRDGRHEAAKRYIEYLEECEVFE